MELAHSLLLNEDALAQITEAKRPVFIFEWLRFLDKVLVAANKVWYYFFSSWVNIYKDYYVYMICKKTHYVLEVVGHLWNLRILHCTVVRICLSFSILWQNPNLV